MKTRNRPKKTGSSTKPPRRHARTKPGLFGGNLHIFKSLPSTNRYAMEHAAHLANGDAVMALEQTAGRGRFDRQWIAPAGKTLAVSVIFKDQQLSPCFLAQSTRITALAIACLLQRHSIPAMIKWPNDVMAGNRKIAGILAETASDASCLVIGAGLNVNMSDSDLALIPAHEKPSSMLEISRRPHDIPALCSEFLEILQHLITEAGNDISSFIADRWQEFDFLANSDRQICILTPSGGVPGMYAGVDRNGQIIITRPDGSTASFCSGDVTLAKEHSAPSHHEPLPH